MQPYNKGGEYMKENKLAEFYKCALQVNCYDYINNRGQNMIILKKNIIMKFWNIVRKKK